VRSEIAVRIDLTSVVVGGLVFGRSDDQDGLSLAVGLEIAISDG
jgi:hypothetical protein